LQALGPDLLVQVHEHVFFEGGFAVVDANAVIVAVEAVNQSLDGGLVEMAQVGGGLTRFLAEHEGLGVDESEGVDYYFAFDGLDGVDDYGNGAGGELFEGLLGINIDRREPAAETGMGMVPSNNSLGSIERVLLDL